LPLGCGGRENTVIEGSGPDGVGGLRSVYPRQPVGNQTGSLETPRRDKGKVCAKVSEKPLSREAVRGCGAGVACRAGFETPSQFGRKRRKGREDGGLCSEY